jgi:transcriptional regulator with XRE-family HTH domain
LNEQKLYQYLGANVYRLRKQRGLTQSELAAYIGCNQKYISQIETGAAKASISICYKIANTFSVSVDSLFTDPEKCVNAGENTSDREFAESITRTIIQYLDTKK